MLQKIELWQQLKNQLGFDDNKKQELNQLVYEMLDEKAKIWIRSPEKVAQIASRNTVDSMETEDMESGR